ncbi:MAG TPA: pyruvate kinase [Elusimicrobia bacterium]|nr:MAG: pyruvate kinase [Elusimicrobia bacterium GWA2_66_18]HAZ07610.1 pyruvate kinase [Elusimicrobiota bacterium]
MLTNTRTPAVEDKPKMTKILATLGPVSAKAEMLHRLLDAGVDAFRLNCSHARLDELKRSVELIRSASRLDRRSTSVVLDLQGPRLRVGRLRNGEPIALKNGARVRITSHDIPGTAEEFSTSFKKLPNTVRKGMEIRLDDGSIVLTVLKTGVGWVDCEVRIGGLLKEHKGINLPGADIDLPALTVKDMRDLAMGLKTGVDHVALSFVRSPDDVLRARKILLRAGAPTRIIAKIEHPDAIKRIDAILDAADGIMIARGDLAVELSAAEVPALQKMLVRKANDAGKLSIVATQMLESMIGHAQPTRAEASDVANAIYDGADVVMLSGESAVGLYPVETVKVMADIIHKAETSNFRYRMIPHGLTDNPDTGFAHALARAAHDACQVTGTKLVVVYTMTGWSARIMSKYRPRTPIIAMTPLKQTYQQLALYWGITPLICPLGKSTDEMLAYGERILLKSGLVKNGETTLVTCGGTAKHKASNMLKIHVVGSLTYR